MATTRLGISPATMGTTTVVLPDGGQPLVADERLFETREGATRTAEVSLEGVPVLLRPVCPADVRAIAELVAGLSERSTYLRFHGPLRSLSSAQLAGLVDVDHLERETLLAFVRGRRGKLRLVGIGQYVATGPTAAEVALVVADEWQGRGLGRALAEHAMAAARRAGYATLRASVLAENRAALGLMRSLGFAPEGIAAGSVLELTCGLGAPAEAFDRDAKTGGRPVPLAS